MFKKDRTWTNHEEKSVTWLRICDRIWWHLSSSETYKFVEKCDSCSSYDCCARHKHWHRSRRALIIKRCLWISVQTSRKWIFQWSMSSCIFKQHQLSVFRLCSDQKEYVPNKTKPILWRTWHRRATGSNKKKTEDSQQHVKLTKQFNREALHILGQIMIFLLTRIYLVKMILLKTKSPKVVSSMGLDQHAIKTEQN